MNKDTCIIKGELSSIYRILFISNYKTTTSRQPRKLNFGMQAYVNPTIRIVKRISLTPWWSQEYSPLLSSYDSGSNEDQESDVPKVDNI